MEQKTQICRTCLLETNRGLKDIFTETFDYSETINMLTQLTLIPGDSLPQKICKFCVMKIQKIQTFKLMCIQSDKVLHERLQLKPPLDEIEVCLIQEIHEFSEVEIKKESPEREESIVNDDHHQESFTNEASPITDDEEIPLKLLKNSLPKKKQEIPYDKESPESKELIAVDDNHQTQESFTNEASVTDDEEIPLKMLKNSLPKKKQEIPYDKESPERKELIAVDDNHQTQESFTNETSVTYDEEIPLKMLKKSLPKKKQKIPCDKEGESKESADKDEMPLKIKKSLLKKKLKANNALYSCEFCGKMYEKYRLTFHLNGHNKVYPFVCSVEGCDAKFTAPFRLKTHEQDVHSGKRPYTCDFCNKTYKKIQYLNIHRKLHTEPSIPCTVCNNLIKNKEGMKKHMRTHTGEKPHSCQYCDKTFSNLYNLKTHLRTHTGDKPYKCNFCEAAFGYGNLLKNHLEKNHPNQTM